jgi:hypothetical protein
LLYAITHRRNVSIASVFSTISLNITFRRGLVGNNITLWFMLVARVAHIRLTGARDKFIWDLLRNGAIMVKSMYNVLIMDTRVRYNMILWKMKVPLRIKIFFLVFET